MNAVLLPLVTTLAVQSLVSMAALGGPVLAPEAAAALGIRGVASTNLSVEKRTLA